MTRRVASAAVVVAVSSMLAPGPLHGETEPRPRTVEVTIDDNVYEPKRIAVRPGTTVEWRNEGRNEHNVLPDKGTRFGDAEIDRGATYSFRFDEPGKYGYYCSFHGAPRTGQFGTVKVVDEAGQKRRQERGQKKRWTA